MTFREKFEKEHPDMNIAVAIVENCPSDYGYERYTPRCPMGREQNCAECWDREIPETNLVVGDAEVEHPDTDIPKKNPSCNDLRESAGLPRILDSGNRRQFESGAVRDIQEGKGRCDLLPLDVVADIYKEFITEHPNISELLYYISDFQKTGEVTHLYHALNNFEFESWSGLFLDISKHFEEGAKKYGENNWQKGIPVHCYIDSAVRHYLKFLRGDKDEPHDRAFCWNIICAIWTCKHKPELNEYAPKAPKLGYDPVQKAYDIAKSAYNGDQSNIAYALEEIVGYLGEALE